MIDIERDDEGLHFSCPQCGEYLGVSHEYLEERTCHVVRTVRYDYEYGYAGTEYITELSCGHKYVDSHGDEPNYCPVCGAQVTKRFHTEEKRGTCACGRREDDWNEGDE